MREKSYLEDFTCFICDYWYLVLIILGLLFWGFWLLRQLPAAITPIPTPLPTSTTLPATEEPVPTRTPRVVTDVPPALTETPAVTEAVISETPQQTQEPTIETAPTKPVYIFGLIPVNWQGSDEEFTDIANNYLDYFVEKSGMDEYFEIQLQILDAPPNLDANNENIINELTYYGMSQFPADRYIGITSQNIVLEGDADIVGFTQGDNAYSVLSEADDASVVAHELGHTYGLCDEYSYEAWMYQNEDFPQGCPNPLASSCRNDGEMCTGVFTDRGLNSMMGAAGYDGGYGFNTDCYNYLQERFQKLAESVNQ